MIMMTGLSGSGKSTLAVALQAALKKENCLSDVIDGDVYRGNLSKDLGFSESDRRENMRRLFNVALTKKELGIIPIIAAINPYDDLRRQLCSGHNVKLIHIHCAVEKLIARDPKGLYKRAFLPDDHPDKITNLTGINDRYDFPSNADMAIDTTNEDVELSVNRLVQYVMKIINPGANEVCPVLYTIP